jgi:hypothetical protein
LPTSTVLMHWIKAISTSSRWDENENE